MQTDYLFLKANKNIEKGEIILDLGNDVCHKSNPARLQIDENTFIKLSHCIQHSCNPNSFIDWRNYQLKALRDIKKGEVVTYHYGISEDDYSVGEFDCSCGSSDCVVHFRGFKFMTTAKRNKIKKYVSPFLRNKYYQK
jgi:SET domain-containing protein